MSGDLTKCDIISGMPQLKPRTELFVQTYVRGARDGVTARQAHISAGFKGRDGVADACASRLLSSEKVQARIAELTKPMTRKTQISVDSLTAEVQETIASAKAKGQNAVVLKGVELAAKLHGMLRERVDITHDFGGTRAEVLARIAARYGQDAANVLTELLGEPEKPMIELRAKVAERKVDETSAELTAGLAKD
jgi:hypothetical protein